MPILLFVEKNMNQTNSRFNRSEKFWLNLK